MMQHISQYLHKRIAAINRPGRYFFLDLLRGLTLLSMILYHGTWDYVYFYGKSLPWYNDWPGYLWQQSICWTFILLSGISLSLGRSTFPHRLHRGLLLTVCGLLITAVTFIAVPEDPVIFGVLNFYGLAMIVTGCVEKMLRRLSPHIGLVLFALLFFLTRDINAGALGFEGILSFPLPSGLYRNLFTTVLGFPYAGFYSSDYFSLFPWLFLFWAGLYLGRLLFEHPGKICSLLSERICPPLEMLGALTLPIYMIHQPLLMLLFTILSLF